MNDLIKRMAARDRIHAKLLGNVGRVAFKGWRATTSWQLHPVACMCYSCVVEKVRVPAEHRMKAREDFKNDVYNEFNYPGIFQES